VQRTATSSPPKSLAIETEPLGVPQLRSQLRAKDASIAALNEQVAALTHQLEWFKRQIFGSKSERFAPEPDPKQLHLGEAFPVAPPPLESKSIRAHTRRVAVKDGASDGEGEALPFFDESKVPLQTIVLMPENVQGLSADQYEIIGEKVTYRLAQRPGSYEVLKYRRPVVKLKGRAEILTVPAPASIFEGSRADVSFAAGMLVDKFAWHLPLYRQHQRLEAAGIRVARPWLTQLTQRSIQLLTPIYEAQLRSIRASRVKAMDETPIKAGRSGHGKMRTGYFWPIYGEREEVCFPFHPSRSATFVSAALGLSSTKDSVLLSDGYAAYERYAKQTGLTHAQCWSHCRRGFFESLEAEPTFAAEALGQIAALYAVEEDIRRLSLTGEAKQLHRLTHAKPILERFFDWVDKQLERHGLTPSHPFLKALAYARERRAGLTVFLSDPDVPIDTNHLERALRVIPMGRKAWLFCWTELGAQHVGIIQSLIVTCRLHDIDPYTYLVDVLQRVAEHPASQVAELTPRRWKPLFAHQPLRSDIHDFPR
jgi:transposase